MTPLEKALADISLSKRSNEDSSSIKDGCWVGIGAVDQIVVALNDELQVGRCIDCSNYRNDDLGKWCYWHLENVPESGFCHNYNKDMK